MKTELSTPNAVPVPWMAFKTGKEKIRLGTVEAKYWIQARELAEVKYGLERGQVDVEPATGGSLLWAQFSDAAEKETPGA